jgi:putative ABC transport system substrate-binding protein
VQLQFFEVRVPEDIDGAFQAMTQNHADALFVSECTRIPRSNTVKLAAKSRLPAIYPGSSSVDAGGLMSYGADRIDSYRRAATYVDKILKGTKPADLPVAQPTKFELVINLKTAKQIGLTITPNLLARADKVIR